MSTSASKMEPVIKKEVLIQDIVKALGGQPARFDTALLIASNEFHLHDDRSGRSYMHHLLRVVKGGTWSNKKAIIGVLHDLIEDRNWTLEDLNRVRFEEDVIKAVDFVTKRSGERYFDFVVRCGTSFDAFPSRDRFLAIDVKIADLDDNMSVNRQTDLMTTKYTDKLDVYIIARNYLVAIKQEHIKPGTSMHDFMEMYQNLKSPELLAANSAPPRQMNLNFMRTVQDACIAA